MTGVQTCALPISGDEDEIHHRQLARQGVILRLEQLRVVAWHTHELSDPVRNLSHHDWGVLLPEGRSGWDSSAGLALDEDCDGKRNLATGTSPVGWLASMISIARIYVS